MLRTLAPSFGFATKNLKIIKLRMKAVESIRKITKAMKMVSAAKMKQDVGRLDRGKGFGVGSLNKVFDNQSYLQKKKPTLSAKKTLLVPITSDRGLCGGINSGVIREIKATVKGNQDAYKVFVVGDKGSLALSRIFPQLVSTTITNLITPMNFPTAASIANTFVRESGDCDRIVIVYNEFKNVITQVLRKLQVLSKKDFQRMFKLVFKHKIVHPGPQYSTHYFYDFYVCAAFYNALLNNLASEQSARMNAMENASKNAGEIVDKLTLEYNKVRQGKITQELSEIVSGAAAV